MWTLSLTPDVTPMCSDVTILGTFGINSSYACYSWLDLSEDVYCNQKVEKCSDWQLSVEYVMCCFALFYT